MKKTIFNTKNFLLILIVIIFSTIIICFLNNGTSHEQGTFEIKYKNSIDKYCKDYNVDKYLVYAMIKQESNFNNEAVSSAKARGLMQMTEDTFNWLKPQLGESSTTFDDLFDADTNIRYGVFFISVLQKSFSEQNTVVAAYNAGMNITSEWLQDSDYSNDGVTLHTIPYKETANYVIVVDSNYKKYLNLYGSK
ncbi:lytic transglycosylase domain-containing protein [Clostridium sp. UBA1056]|uniref:lytic transglycosylase domain-containing protein n=1 Tax=unclassified Clostridium TaxID=2614128 RepID=UPI0032172B73